MCTFLPFVRVNAFTGMLYHLFHVSKRTIGISAKNGDATS